MANKSDYVVWVIIVLVLCGLMWFIVEPIIWWTDYSEARLYIRIFLILFAVLTFAVLRLYNSIVQNTRFNIKLRESFVKLTSSLLGFDRGIRNLNSTMGNVKASADSLKKSLDSNEDSTDRLTEKLNKLKS